MNIKRKNKILVGCLALLLVLSVGYALFSETITINGTATAKGDFSYDISCYTGLPEIAALNYTSGGYENNSCDVNDNKITYNVDLLYPSATIYFTQEITNTGSISMVLYLDEVYEYNTCLYNISDDSQVSCTNTSTSMTYNEGMFYGYKTSDGTFYDMNELDNSKYALGNASYLIETGNTIYLGVKLMWPSSWTDKTKYFKITGTEQISLKQITN